MKRSVDRILTTHTGSLPRPPDLTEMMFAREDGKADPAAVAARVREAVTEIVGKQAEVGVDVVNDGEVSKIGYSTYVKDRLTGFGGEGSMPGLGDMVEFPTYQERMFRELGRGMEYLRTPACTGPIALRDREQVRTDIENLRAAVQSVQTEDVFMTAASSGVWRSLPSSRPSTQATA